MDTTTRMELNRLAASQHGVFTTAQARNLGVTRSALESLASRGHLGRVDRGVWSVAGSARSPEQLALGALLRKGPDAVLGLSSAAWVWQLPGRRLEPIHVVRARADAPARRAHDHTSRLLTEIDVTRRRGLPVTTPVRTIFDLAGRQHRERTRKDLNDLMARGLVTTDLLDAGLERLAKRGRTGIAVMRELVAEVHEKGAPAGSSLELLAEDVLEAVGFRHMERQVPVYDDAGFVARVDFGDRRRLIALEVDSDRFHGGLVDRQLDAHKRLRLARAGWTVHTITEHELWWDRPALVTRLQKLMWSTRPIHGAEAHDAA